MSEVLPALFLAAFAVLFGVIILRMFSGDINTRGLVSTSKGAPLDPERMQALIAAIGIPAAYAAETLATFHQSRAISALPEVPEWMLVGAAASQVLYIAGKIVRTKV